MAGHGDDSGYDPLYWNGPEGSSDYNNPVSAGQPIQQNPLQNFQSASVCPTAAQLSPFEKFWCAASLSSLPGTLSVS